MDTEWDNPSQTLRQKVARVSKLDIHNMLGYVKLTINVEYLYSSRNIVKQYQEQETHLKPQSMVTYVLNMLWRDKI